MYFVFFFKQKTAYEMRISDWSSDVCSSDLHGLRHHDRAGEMHHRPDAMTREDVGEQLGIPDVALIERYFRRNEAARALRQIVQHNRSEERRVGQACVSTCRSRWLTYP